MSETTKKVILGSGVIVAAVALGYLALQPDDTVPQVAPLPPWRESRPEVAAAPVMEPKPLALSGLALNGSVPQLNGRGEISPSDVALSGIGTAEVRQPRMGGALSPATPVTVIIDATLSLSPLSLRVEGARVFAGAAEQVQARSGTLQIAGVQKNAPAVPAWLDGWLWPTWRGAAPVAPDGAIPVVVWPAPAPDRPHLVAVMADASTPLKPLAEYLAADAQAMAVIIGWEETDHDFRPDAALDAARAEAVAKVVRAARPGLPVWLVCSLTVTGAPEQAAAKVAAVQPDALVLYGLFARGAWDSDKVVAVNLARGEKLLPGKPVYAAGQRLTGDDLQAAIDRARRLGWKGMLCDGSAR